MGVEGNRTDHAAYGIDAPRVVRNATLAGSACGLLAPLLAYDLLRPRRRTLAIGALVLGARRALEHSLRGQHALEQQGASEHVGK
jgi:hypothetical protein